MNVNFLQKMTEMVLLLFLIFPKLLHGINFNGALLPFRDKLISQLRLEIENLKYELERTKKEDQRIIESLKRRLMEMEGEMNEHRTVIETQCQVSGHVI